MTTLRRTNTKVFRSAAYAYIAGCIDVEGNKSATFKQKAKDLKRRFHGQKYRADRPENYSEQFQDWLQGLPIGIAYEYTPILEAAAAMHGCNASDFTDKQREMIVSRWFPFMAFMCLEFIKSHDD